MGAEPTLETSQGDAAGPARLVSLKLENFRGFSDLKIDFPADGPAVLIGVNGAGKSTVLDAVAMHLALFAGAARRYLDDDRHLRDTDVKVGTQHCSITARLRIGSHAPVWVLSAPGPTDGSGLSQVPPVDILQQVQVLERVLAQSEAASISTLCSFPATRGLRDRDLALPRRRQAHRQLDAYHDAFERGLGPFQDFVRWFGGAEDIENEARLRRDPAYRKPQLEAIRRALEVFLNALGSSRFSDLRAERHAADDGSVKTVELSALKDGARLGFQQLSEGERDTILLVADIARRLAIANPSGKDPLQGEGIVLIDEIDLHLHPAWQRGIVPALSATFPHIQFIVSTHSPAVLSRVKREHVFILENFELVQRAPHTYGRDANTILAEAMGIPARPKEIEDMIRSASILVDEERLEEAQRALGELTDILGEDDNFIVRLRTLISFLEDDR